MATGRTLPRLRDPQPHITEEQDHTMNRDTFTAATWNVFHDTPPEVLEPILEALRIHGASIILGQEITRPEVRALFPAHGWRMFTLRPELLVAYRTEVWEGIACRGEVLSPTAYDGHHSSLASAILCDRVGRTLTAGSYHTPAHVQVDSPAPNRFRALHESAATLGELGKAAQTRAVLFGGDDNVDEDGAHGPWGFLRRKATGLRLVQAPDPTHAGGRRIDDFRVRGLEPLEGHTLPGGGDHKIHLRTFGWEAVR